MLVDSSTTLVNSRVEKISSVDSEPSCCCRQGLLIQVTVLHCCCAKAVSETKREMGFMLKGLSRDC